MGKRIVRSLLLLLVLALASVVDLLVALQRGIAELGLRAVRLLVALTVEWLLRDPSYSQVVKNGVPPLRIVISFWIAELDVITDLASAIEHHGCPRLRDELAEQLQWVR